MTRVHVVQLKLKQIETGGGTQLREEIPPEGVDDYEGVLRGGGQLPPVVVFHDGQRYWLADGFIRYGAHQAAGRACILAEVRPGTQREAQLHAAGANAEHGWRRTNADKRRAVALLLNDPEWSVWSDHEIARRCAVSQPFVGILRRELKDKPPVPQGDNGYRATAQPPAAQNGTPMPAPPSTPLPPSDYARLEQEALESKRHTEERERLQAMRKRLGQLEAKLREGSEVSFAWEDWLAEGYQRLEEELAAVPA